jgi:hypothetical protein
MNADSLISAGGLAALLLGCTWRLSAQIASIHAKLEAHIDTDDERHVGFDRRIDRLERRHDYG